MMMIKKTKEALLQDIRFAAADAAHNHLSSVTGNYGNTSPSSVIYAVGDAIGLAVQAAMEEYIKAQYTQEEFEDDLGLSNGSV